MFQRRYIKNTMPDKKGVQRISSPAEIENRVGTRREQADEQGNLVFMAQCPLTNTLAASRATRRNTTTDLITGLSETINGDLIIRSPKGSELRAQDFALLDLLTVEATKTGRKAAKVSLSLSDCMEMRGLKDRKAARESVRDSLDRLFNAVVSYSSKVSHKGKCYSGFVDGRLCSEKGVLERGLIYFRFSEKMADMLPVMPISQFPPQMWKIDMHRRPDAYATCRKIYNNYYMNRNEKPPRDQRHTISVSALLEVMSGIPTKEEVAKTGLHFSQRIIEPFEENLCALSDMLSWEYCKAKGAAFTREELARMDFAMFEKAYVKITFIVDPEPSQTAIDAENRKRIEGKKEATREKKKRRAEEEKGAE